MEPTAAGAKAARSDEGARTELLQVDRFAVAQVLRDVFPTALAEMQQVADGDFVPWFANGSYEGSWLVFPLAFVPHGDGNELGVDIARNRARCPRTAAVFDAFGRQRTYGFSRIMPGAHVIAHRDVRPAYMMRMHLPLVVPAGCHFRIGTEHVAWRVGEPLAFDGLIEHEVANFGQAPRTVLLVDFRMDAAEQAYVDAVRARNGVRLD
jgi:hypothetical protein